MSLSVESSGQSVLSNNLLLAIVLILLAGFYYIQVYTIPNAIAAANASIQATAKYPVVTMPVTGSSSPIGSSSNIDMAPGAAGNPADHPDVHVDIAAQAAIASTAAITAVAHKSPPTLATPMPIATQSPPPVAAVDINDIASACTATNRCSKQGIVQIPGRGSGYAIQCTGDTNYTNTLLDGMPGGPWGWLKWYTPYENSMPNAGTAIKAYCTEGNVRTSPYNA